MGEFVLARSTSGDGFEVQVRLSAPSADETQGFTLISEVAIRVGADRVTIDDSRSQPVWINGVPAVFSGNAIALADGTIYRSGSSYQVVLNSGESVTADVGTFNSGIVTSVALGPHAAHNSVVGLLGNFNGNSADDLRLANGTVLPSTLPDSILYGSYADAWRVTQATLPADYGPNQTLLDYGANQTTDTFTDRDYPPVPVTLASFPTDAVQAAMALVQQAGITDPGLMAAAAYDYLITGDTQYLANEHNLQQQGVTTTQQAVVTSPPPAQTLNVLAVNATQVQAATGPTVVDFTVYRTNGDLSAPLTVDYAVLAPDSIDVGATSLGGSLPTGSVTFAANATTATFAVAIPNSIGNRAEAALHVQISDQSDIAVIGAEAQTTIINSQPEPGTPAVFAYRIGNVAANLMQNGSDWTLDAAFKAGQSAGPIQVQVANTAGDLSDDLRGSLATSGSTAFTLSPPSGSTFANLHPGELQKILDLLPDVSVLGSYSETIVVDPVDTNVTGYAAVQQAQTLTVNVTVYPQAVATVNTISPILLPEVRVGTADQIGLSVSNTATGTAESLDAQVGHTDAGAAASGSVSKLAAGATDATGIQVGLDTSTAGIKSGSVTLAFESDGLAMDGLATTLLQNQIVQVRGTVDQGAIPTLNDSVVVHVGGPQSVALSIGNSAPVGARSERLLATLLGSSGGVTATGAAGEIAPGAVNSGITLDFSSAQVGTIAGGATIDLTSDGTGIDSLGTLHLGQQVVSVAVDNYATAALREVSDIGRFTQHGDAYALDLGSYIQGSAVPAVQLALANTATGLADVIGASFIASGASVFTTNGLSDAVGLGAGQSDDAPTLSLTTTSVGTFTETLTITPTASNAGGYSNALSPLTLTVVGTITPSVLAITGTQAEQATTDQASIDPFAHVTVTEAGSVTETATVTLSTTANGVLSHLGVGNYNTAAGVYTVSGSAAVVSTALDGLVFTPSGFQAAPGASVATGFTLDVTSSSGASAADTATSVIATAAGTWEIAAGQTLAIPGASQGQTIDFQGTTGLLVLDRPGSAELTVTGFASGDHIDLAGVSATAAAPVLAAGTLSIGTLHLGFAGDYTGQTFRLAAAADGDAELTVGAPAAVGGHGGTLPLGSGDSNASVSGYGNHVTGQNGDSVVQVGGLDNSVSLGDGRNVVSTPAGSAYTSVTLGDGDNQVALGGTLNTVRLGNGANTVSMTSSNNSITAGDGPDSVSGGTGNSHVTLGGGMDSVALGGWGNSVTVGDGDDSVDPGAGGATIHFGEGNDTVTLNGRNNTVTGGDGRDSVTGGGSTNRVTLGGGRDTVTLGGLGNTIVLGDGANTVSAGAGSDSVQVGGGANSITLAGTGNTVVGGNGQDSVAGVNSSLSSITLGDGADNVQVEGSYDRIVVGNGADSVTLGGVGNTVIGGNGGVSVTGGTAHSTVTLGTGNNLVALGGWVNTVTIGGGTSTVDAGAGASSITVDGGNATLTLHGRADLVFLHNAAQASLTDLSSGLRLGIDSGNVVAAITGFGASRGALLDLTGAGFTSVAQVIAGLHSDGHGGTLLALGGAGSVDFLNLAPNSLHAGNFSVT